METRSTASRKSSASNGKVAIDRAMAAVEAGDLSGAAGILREAVEEHREDEGLNFELGYLLLELGDEAGARIHLEKAVALAPEKNAKKFFALSEVLPPNEAIFVVQKGLNVGLSELDALEARLLALQSAETPEKVKLSRKQAKLRRVIAQGYCKLAESEAMINGGNFNLLDITNRAIAMDPSYLEPYLHLLTHHFNLNETAKTQELIQYLLTKIKELDNDEDDDLHTYDPEFYNAVARMMLEEQKFAEAQEWLEIAVTVAGQDLNTRYLLAYVAFKNEDFPTVKDEVAELEKLGVWNCGDEELVEGFRELKGEVDAKVKVDGPDDEDWEEIDDEEFGE